MIKSVKFSIVFLLLLAAGNTIYAQSSKIPGIVVNHIPAHTGIYIGSPSICILPNGDYVASHDHFGPNSTEHERAVTAVYKSTNKGKSWKKISEINGQFWSNLFVHQNALYIMGTWKHHGNFIIRRSDDGGVTWTAPINNKNGLLFEGKYHTAPMPVIEHDGRLWRTIENRISHTSRMDIRHSIGVISISADADLLNAENWLATNFLPHDSTYFNGKFNGWIEGNAIVTPEGNIVNILRVATSEPGRDMVAVVNISHDGKTASFDPRKGFIDFVGGAKKFSIRYDEKSKRYWTLANMVKEEFSHLLAARVRNTLVLKSSPDLKNWSVHKILLEHSDVEKHGFQYVDWQFDGRHIIFLSRTAYDDEFGGARNYHDANYLTFHRIRNFRKFRKTELSSQ
jgi:hypothetical protein